jgi:hypothetical protein
MKITREQAIKLLRDLNQPVPESLSIERITMKLDFIPYIINEKTDAKESQELLNQFLIAIANEEDVLVEDQNETSIVEPVTKELNFFDQLVHTHFRNKDGTRRKAGVIQAIVEFLCGASEEEPINKQDLVQKIHERFPNKNERSIMASINSQVPTRLKSVRGIKVSSSKSGYWISENDQ